MTDERPLCDPLRHIPSVSVIRRRIAELVDQTKRYGVLLRTAEEMERLAVRGDTNPFDADKESRSEAASQ